jgi:hypothetical protein
MLIQEMIFSQPNTEKKELGFDLKDDLSFFMNNDPEFYRKKYYPTILKLKKYVKDDKTVGPRAFEGLVNYAYECYRNKFNTVEGLSESLDKEILESLCKHILESEVKNIKDGQYD